MGLGQNNKIFVEQGNNIGDLGQENNIEDQRQGNKIFVELVNNIGYLEQGNNIVVFVLVGIVVFCEFVQFFVIFVLYLVQIFNEIQYFEFYNIKYVYS